MNILRKEDIAIIQYIPHQNGTFTCEIEALGERFLGGGFTKELAYKKAILKAEFELFPDMPDNVEI